MKKQKNFLKKAVFLAAFLAIGVLAVAGCILCEPKVQETPAVPVVAPEPEIPKISLAAAGDVMLARKLDRLMKERGIDYPFSQTAAVLFDADLAFANLESPLSTRGEKLLGKGIWFRGRPENAQALVQAGFDVLSIANNHAVDYDSPALLDTIEILQGFGIKTVGGGENIAAARRPVSVEVKGIKVTFLAYSEMTDIVWSFKYPRRLKATEDTPGIAPLVVDEILADVAAIREETDFVVVSLHWGTEYRHQPESYQQEIAHRLIDGGVDLIIGHHPHCLQGIEVYKNGLIAYSLGNFVFDQNWSDMTREGLLLKMIITPDGWEDVNIYPIFINDGQPVIAEGEQAESILSLTRNISEKLGTKIEIQDGKGII